VLAERRAARNLAASISEIFRYELRGPAGMDSTQLKTIQTGCGRRLRIVPGVADVAVMAEIQRSSSRVDLNKMMAAALTLPQVINAISSSNVNVAAAR